MNVVITDQRTGALVAYVTDQVGNRETAIVCDGYEVQSFGNNQPVFEADEDGNVYVKENAFIMDPIGGVK